MTITIYSHYLVRCFQLLLFLGFFFLSFYLSEMKHQQTVKTQTFIPVVQEQNISHLNMFGWWSEMGASLLGSKHSAARNKECAALESSDSLGASPSPSSALCPLQVSNIQRESRANRQTDGKYIIKRRKKSLSDVAPGSGQHLDPTEASASRGASLGASGLPMSSSSYVTFAGVPCPPLQGPCCNCAIARNSLD